jgi:hypothetical protein
MQQSGASELQKGERTMTYSKRTWIGAAAALIAAQILTPTAQAAMGLSGQPAKAAVGKLVTPAAAGACNVNRVKFRTSVNQNSTFSIAFVDVPDSFVSIDIGGANPSCVIVTFSASARVVNSIMYVRAHIPQLNASAHPETAFFTALSGNLFHAHSMQFVFPSIPPGQYSVRVQFRSQNGQLVVVGTRTVTVQYRQ